MNKEDLYIYLMSRSTLLTRQSYGKMKFCISLPPAAMFVNKWQMRIKQMSEAWHYFHRTPRQTQQPHKPPTPRCCIPGAPHSQVTPPRGGLGAGGWGLGRWGEGNRFRKMGRVVLSPDSLHHPLTCSLRPTKPLTPSKHLRGGGLGAAQWGLRKWVEGKRVR